MALLDSIETILPGWALELAHWMRVGVAGIALIDALVEAAYDGVFAGLPGQQDGLAELGGFPSLDGLPLIGRDRGIRRGLRETPGSYAAALRRWRASKRRAGTGFEILQQVRRVLGPNPPRVRAVASSGVWHTIEPDGTLLLHTPEGTGFSYTPAGVPSALPTPAHPWDWDGAPDLYRFWLIIYVPTTTTGLVDGDDGTLDDGTSFWGRGGLIGVRSSTALVEQLRGIVDEWAPEGVACPYIIFAFDPASFDPETPGPYPAAGMPDGHWGRYGRDIGGTYVRARLATARYVRGTS